jgi:hypothetical protein
MQPVSASQNLPSQIFSAFNIGIVNVYMFIASDRSRHAAESYWQGPRNQSYRRLGARAQNGARQRIVIDKRRLADNPFGQ